MEAAVQLPVMTARLDILGRVCESDEPSTVAAGGIGDIEILGDYVLTRQIARGMTGEVWLGLQMFLGELVRPVAIKRIDPVICTDPSLKRRFLREAAIMDRVRAPGIVPIYEIGMDRYHYFIASAFVQGETIADLLAASKRDRDPIPAAVAARIAADALAGLHALHIVEYR
jgi:serine/threonine-protein kinase